MSESIRAKCRRILTCLYSNDNWYYVFIIRSMVVFFVKFLMKVVGPTMLVFANVLICTIMYFFVIHLIPDPDVVDSTWKRWVHTVVGLFLFVNIMFNYISCAMTPGGTPEVCDDPAPLLGTTTKKIDGRKVKLMNFQLNIQPGVYYRYCRHCRCIKPPRSHHCGISQKCICHMDHYCPWMANTVGYANYRYFYLFLFWLCAGCAYGMLVLLEAFHKANTPKFRRMVYLKGYNKNFVVVTIFSILIAACFSVGLLLAIHTYLTLTNQTTIEFYINWDNASQARKMGLTYKNPFDKGLRKNLRRVFGDVPWYLALCISRRPPGKPEFPFDLEELRTYGPGGGGGGALMV